MGISLTFRRLSSLNDAPVPRGRSRRDVINSVCQAHSEMSICFPRLTQQIPFVCKHSAVVSFATKPKNYSDDRDEVKSAARQTVKINTSPCRWADSREMNMFFRNKPLQTTIERREMWDDADIFVVVFLIHFLNAVTQNTGCLLSFCVQYECDKTFPWLPVVDTVTTWICFVRFKKGCY